MVDPGGATFSLMYLPAGTVNLPTPVAAIIPLTPATRAALGLGAVWDVSLTRPTADNLSAPAQTLVLCAVYPLGQVPSL